ncbi:hypothetical protein HIM_08036 [Hirsutella minnesotensis 3608]|uniref:Pierisin-like domain-containing protein n=1 Tax=Hirsutella minnesotensis 3608 TaxID=1043627 RepID=A0A0F7ZYI1_9HYPO|nr:hypothetical protein HIM_08036 [Hirsutella minnesotensis 3608]
MRLSLLLLASALSACAAPLSDDTSPATHNTLERRGKPDGERDAMSPADASKKVVPDGTAAGFFFRGDSRPYTEVFQTGFTPQGNDMNLQHHLSFAGNSGYVPTSRSRPAASRYVYGRSGGQTDVGYLYVIAPMANVPEGYWVPEIFSRDPAVQGNQEFAVAGAIPASAIAGVYVFRNGDRGAPREWIPNDNYAGRDSNRYDPNNDSCFKRFCKKVSGLARSWTCRENNLPQCVTNVAICGPGQSQTECEDGHRFRYQAQGAQDDSIQIDHIFLEDAPGPSQQNGQTPSTTPTPPQPGPGEAAEVDPSSEGLSPDILERLRLGSFEGLNCAAIIAALSLAVERSRPRRSLPEMMLMPRVALDDTGKPKDQCQQAREMVTPKNRRKPDLDNDGKSAYPDVAKNQGGPSKSNGIIHDELRRKKKEAVFEEPQE